MGGSGVVQGGPFVPKPEGDLTGMVGGDAQCLHRLGRIHLEDSRLVLGEGVLGGQGLRREVGGLPMGKIEERYLKDEHHDHEDEPACKSIDAKRAAGRKGSLHHGSFHPGLFRSGSLGFAHIVVLRPLVHAP